MTPLYPARALLPYDGRSSLRIRRRSSPPNVMDIGLLTIPVFLQEKTLDE